MKTLLLSFKPFLFFFLLGFVVVTTTQSCSPRFDPTGSDYAKTLGATASTLMAKATGEYSSNEKAANDFLAELGKAQEHAASIKRNKEIAQMWKILKDDLAAPFFNRWKEKGKLDKDFVKESITQVTKSFDSIKRAESAKKK
jgi:hypothetical protein